MSAPDAETAARWRGAPGDGSAAWYEREVPGIVRGLESSGTIGGETAGTARTLVAQGRARTALELVMAAVEDT